MKESFIEYLEREVPEYIESEEVWSTNKKI
jgi:hypothetical protein